MIYRILLREGRKHRGFAFAGSRETAGAAVRDWERLGEEHRAEIVGRGRSPTCQDAALTLLREWAAHPEARGEGAAEVAVGGPVLPMQ